MRVFCASFHHHVQKCPPKKCPQKYPPQECPPLSLRQYFSMLYFVWRKLVRHWLSKPLAVFRVELRVFCASFHQHVQKCPQKFLHSNIPNWKLCLLINLLKYSVLVFWLGDLFGHSVWAICLGGCYIFLGSLFTQSVWVICLVLWIFESPRFEMVASPLSSIPPKRKKKS